jgi:hypothetical protein
VTQKTVASRTCNNVLIEDIGKIKEKGECLMKEDKVLSSENW